MIGLKLVCKHMVGPHRISVKIIGLHQGSTLNHYLFTLVLAIHTQHIQEVLPQCILFANDIVLVGESRRNKQ